MALTVVWTDEAERNLDEISEFVLLQWNEKILSQFLNSLIHSLKQIQKFPESFPVSLKTRGVRKCIVTKHVSLFYSMSDIKITIIALSDNRQDDNKLK